MKKPMIQRNWHKLLFFICSVQLLWRIGWWIWFLCRHLQSLSFYRYSRTYFHRGGHKMPYVVSSQKHLSWFGCRSEFLVGLKFGSLCTMQLKPTGSRLNPPYYPPSFNQKSTDLLQLCWSDFFLGGGGVVQATLYRLRHWLSWCVF